MTPEIENKRRELFEAWFDKEVLQTISYGSRDILKRQMWRPFNAALDAVEIERPRATCSMFATSREAMAGSEGIDMCITAITATGLGLKIKE